MCLEARLLMREEDVGKRLLCKGTKLQSGRVWLLARLTVHLNELLQAECRYIIILTALYVGTDMYE